MILQMILRKQPEYLYHRHLTISPLMLDRCRIYLLLKQKLIHLQQMTKLFFRYAP